MDKQIKHFFNVMEQRHISIFAWKAYPPNSFEGITNEMTVIDTDKGIFAISAENTIFTYGKCSAGFKDCFPQLIERTV